MQFDVRGVIFALLSIVPAIFLAGCVTTASSSVTANNPHPDLPANYRKQIAEFMRTQMFASMRGIRGAEISDPNRTVSILGMRDVVCVRFGGGGWPNFSTVRAYAFTDGQLQWGTGGIVSQFGQGVLTEAMACGANPNFKPFPEADYQRPQTSAIQVDTGLMMTLSAHSSQ
jgi:hypothetical protein